MSTGGKNCPSPGPRNGMVVQPPYPGSHPYPKMHPGTGPLSPQMGPTPTLNSLLQPRPGYDPRAPAPGSYGNFPPKWAEGYQGYPQQPPSMPARPPYGGPGYGYQAPGGYPPPHHGYGPTPQPTGSEAPNNPNTNPPPHPGQHEGRPSQTWTPPVPTKKNGKEAPNGKPSEGGEDQGHLLGNGTACGPAQTTARPSPSPTESSSSRSMSPAVSNPSNSATTAATVQPSPGGGPPPSAGSMPPRPPSGPNAGNGPVAPPPNSHGGPPMGGQPPPMGSYLPQGPPAMGPPSHMMYPAKMGQGGPPPGVPHNQQMPPYGPGGTGGYPVQHGHRPGYGGPPGPYSGYGARPNMHPGQYPGYGGHYPPQGSWGGPGGPPHQMSGPPQKMSQPPRHPGAPAPYPPQQRPGHPGMKGYPPNSYNGPPTSAPSYNGPGAPPPVSNASGPPNSTGGYPGSYPNSTPPQMNSYGMNSSTPPSSTASGPPPSVTNSTGPDGIPIHDDSSQQSTLSQSSDRSDGGRQTPKQNPPSYMGGPPGSYPPASPHGSVPSPGHDNSYGRDMGSPSWSNQPRMAPSPASGMPPHPSISNSVGGMSSNSLPTAPIPSAMPAGSMGAPPPVGPHGTPPSSAGPGGSGPPSSDPTTPAPPTPTMKSSKNAKTDTLLRLYEMDEHPERRMFLDKLLHFMEDRGTPIAQCPTISKNPLDLFRLYVYTKERGGFMECTKNKTWKDIAAQLGIGASSSGAYTLKKHYGKNLLPYECQFDRGGIDPAPLLAQVEAQSKKKPPKNAQPAQPPPAPSPGSQDSRDSSSNFSGGGSTTGPPNPPEAYNSHPPPTAQPPPGGASSGYPPYNYPPNSIAPPSTVAENRPPPSHAGGGYPPHNGGYGSPYPPPPGASGPYPNNYPPNAGPPRQGWPSAPPGAGYMGPPPPNGTASPSPASNDMYNRPGWNQPGGYAPRPGYNPPPGSGPPAPNLSAGNGTSSAPGYPPHQGPYPEQYQPKPLPPHPGAPGPPLPLPGAPQSPSPSSAGPPSGPPPSGNGPTGPPPGIMPPSPKPGMPPPAARPQSPQFVPTPSSNTSIASSSSSLSSSVESQISGRPVILKANSSVVRHGFSSHNFNQSVGSPSGTTGVPPAYSNPPSKGPSGPQVRPPGPPGSYPYPQRPPAYAGSQSWPQRYSGPGGPPPGSYPSSQQSTTWTPGAPMNGPRPGAPWSGQYANSSWGPGAMNRPRGPYRPEMVGKGSHRPGFSGMRGRDMVFPHGCVEATPPLMMKRRKYTKLDVQPIEGWRLVMSLKSGLLMESTWALDALNILLYDDHAFTYFGLTNMPGLFEAILEHWRASLISMFGITEDLEIPQTKIPNVRSRKRAHQEEKRASRKWFETASFGDDEDPLDSLFNLEDSSSALGEVKNMDMADKCLILSGSDHTKKPRFSEEDVEVQSRDDALFITDGKRCWDPIEDTFDRVSSLHWTMGGGNSTSHIVSPFLGDMGIVPFVQLLKEMNPAKYATRKVISNGPIKVEQPEEVEENGPGGPIKSEPNANEDHDGGVVEPAKPIPEEDIVEKIKRLTGIVLRDPELARQRFKDQSLEDECYMRDEPSLQLVTDAQDNIGRRAVCVSTILRNLSFVPGNEFEFSRSASFLRIAGRLLLLYHWYPARTPKQRNYDRGVEEEETGESCSSLTGESEWWWDNLHVIRENVMVILANIAGSLELRFFDEDVVKPILHGLLEWSVSSSSYAQDPFPYVGPNSPVSPQRLAIETLCKLCLYEQNVDLILSTPPFPRLVKLTRLLAKKLYRYEDQVLREFSINMLYYFSAADSGITRTIALADNTVGLMLGFIEQAEQNAMVVAQQHGVNALRDNPDSMGTSLDMLRRAASTLNNLSRHKDNIALFVKHEERILSLVMSQILDQGVAAILSNVLFNIGSDQDRVPPTPAFVSKEEEKDEDDEPEVERDEEDEMTPDTKVKVESPPDAQSPEDNGEKEEASS